MYFSKWHGFRNGMKFLAIIDVFFAFIFGKLSLVINLSAKTGICIELINPGILFIPIVLILPFLVIAAYKEDRNNAAFELFQKDELGNLNIIANAITSKYVHFEIEKLFNTTLTEGKIDETLIGMNNMKIFFDNEPIKEMLATDLAILNSSSVEYQLYNLKVKCYKEMQKKINEIMASTEYAELMKKISEYDHQKKEYKELLKIYKMMKEIEKSVCERQELLSKL